MSLIKAEIYVDMSLEREVRTQAYESISEGLEHLSSFLGSISIGRRKGIKNLPKLIDGSFDITRFSSAGMDYLKELHITATPLEQNTLGLAGSSSGYSWIDPFSDKETIRHTTVHEVSHSLGFVLPDSPQNSGDNHCSDASCVMFESKSRYGIPCSDEAIISVLDKLGFGSIFNDVPVHNSSFCSCCRADIRAEGSVNIEALRARRFALAEK